MLRLLITSDSNIETGVTDANLALCTTKFYKFLENQNYGDSIKEITIIFMCRSPHLVFNRRLRFRKLSEELSFGIMMDYNLFANMTHEQRVTELCRNLLVEIPPTVNKYKFKDFDLDKFMTNLNSWFTQNNYI